jgi:hypothetical protein
LHDARAARLILRKRLRRSTPGSAVIGALQGAPTVGMVLG